MRIVGVRTRWVLPLMIPASLTLLTAAGCGEVKPLDYTPIDEIPPGPDLLSGPDGAFVLYGGAGSVSDGDG